MGEARNGMVLCGLGTGGLQLATDGSFAQSSLQNNWMAETEKLLPGSFLAVSAKGVSGRGFMGLDSTLDLYREQYWHPALYERDFLPQWQHQGGVGIRRRAHEMIRELIGRHDYEPSADVVAELEGIVARARAALV